MSISFVGLILSSIFSFFQQKKLTNNWLLIAPTLLFITLLISLLYSSNFEKGGKIIISQIEFLALPFIFFVHQIFIKKRFWEYIKIFISATSIAAFLTIFFFLLPPETTQNIVAAIPSLKEYIIHEKELAFGIYSPFIDRLQFSYLVGMAIFFQLWVIFRQLEKGIFFIKNNYLSPIIKLILLLLTLLILGARGAQISFLIAAVIWIIGGYFQFVFPIIKQKFNALFANGLLIFGLFFFLIIAPFFAYKNIPAVKVRYEQMQWEIGTFQDGTFKNYNYTHFTSIRRVLSWKNSWAIIQENPFLGVGIGDYQKAMEKEYQKDGLGFPVNTQSQFLYYWTASGILGLLALLFLFGFLFVHCLYQKEDYFKLLGFSFLLFYSIIFLFDAPLNFQVGGMTFLVFYCLISTYSKQEKTNAIPVKKYTSHTT